MTEKKDNEAVLKRALKRFQISSNAWEENAANAKDDLQFGRFGEQWPQGIKRQRELEGRPCLTINSIPAFVRQVVNDARQNKPAINVHPVDNKADVETAKILTGIIRHIEVNSKSDIATDTAVDQAVSMGFGYIRVDLDYTCDDTFDLDIKINRINNPFTVYPDPYSTSADGSDWMSCFITEMIPEEEFTKKYPDATKTDFDSQEVDKLWYSSKSVRVAEYWERKKVKKTIHLLSNGDIQDEDIYAKQKEMNDLEGVEIVKTRQVESHKVVQYILNGLEILEKNEWVGKFIPIIPVYGEEITDEDGKRYFFSLFHHAKDAQRNKNYWRSSATELVALAPKTPFVGKVGFAKTDPNWDTANIRNHPYLEYDGDVAPQRQPFVGVPAGALQEALNANDDIKAIIGMYDASLGARSNEVSGRAIMARQREGDVSTFHFIDNLTRSIRQLGLCILDLIPHVYGGQRIMRIMGEDNNVTPIPVNQPVVVTKDGVITAEQAMQDNIKGMEKVFDLTIGKYDIIVKAGASYTSRREEAAQQMMELVKIDPAALPVIGDLIVRNLDWTGADEIADRLASINPYLQQQQAADDPKAMQAQMEQEAMQKALAESELRLKAAEAHAKEAEALVKMREAQQPPAAYNAEAEKLVLDQKKHADEMILKEYQINQTSELEKQKMVLTAELETQKTLLQEQTKREIEAIRCENKHNMEAMTQVNDMMTQAIVKQVSGRLEEISTHLKPKPKPRIKKVSVIRDANGDMQGLDVQELELEQDDNEKEGANNDIANSPS